VTRLLGKPNTQNCFKKINGGKNLFQVCFNEKNMTSLCSVTGIMRVIFVTKRCTQNSFPRLPFAFTLSLQNSRNPPHWAFLRVFLAQKRRKRNLLKLARLPTERNSLLSGSNGLIKSTLLMHSFDSCKCIRYKSYCIVLSVSSCIGIVSLFRYAISGP